MSSEACGDGRRERVDSRKRFDLHWSQVSKEK